MAIYAIADLHLGFDKRVEKVSPEKIEGVLEPQWHNEVLRIGVEFAGDMGRWQRGAAGAGTGDWMIQGWTLGGAGQEVRTEHPCQQRAEPRLSGAV